jgi:multiple sugar transport system substrate-binding protein
MLRKFTTNLVVLLACCVLLVSCAPDRTEYYDGKKVIEYWEKWGGFEADAMRVIVDEYNESQDKYYVQYVADAGSQIDRKLMISIAGGNPPDISGFWDDRLISYVQNGALTPLDGLMEKDGIEHDRYLPNIIEACQYEGYTWGLPSTPATLALFYNKKMFREAGLDPDKPPRTIAELTEYSHQITKKTKREVCYR